MGVHAILEKKVWSRRSIVVQTDFGVFKVEYDPTAMGSEAVYINDALAVRKRSIWWYVPRFDFPLGNHIALLEVRFNPWLTLRSFTLSVDGEVVYAEHGSRLEDSERALIVRLIVIVSVGTTAYVTLLLLRLLGFLPS